MGSISAKQLKQETGEVMKRVRAGEQLTITYRGKPIAIISPSLGDEHRVLKGRKAFEKAWAGIEEAINGTEPRFEGWQEATQWVRKRI